MCNTHKRKKKLIYIAIQLVQTFFFYTYTYFLCCLLKSATKEIGNSFLFPISYFLFSVSCFLFPLLPSEKCNKGNRKRLHVSQDVIGRYWEECVTNLIFWVGGRASRIFGRRSQSSVKTSDKLCLQGPPWQNKSTGSCSEGSNQQKNCKAYNLKKEQGWFHGQGSIFSNISKGTAFLLQGMFETDPVARYVTI